MIQEQFAKSITEEYGEVRPFEPYAYYDPDGDCIEFLVSNDLFRGKRLDRWVTVYYSEKTDEIVGALIKGVKKMMVEYPGLDIEIKGGAVAIACILRAPAWSSGDEVVKKTYKTMIQKAEEACVTAEFQHA